MIRKGTSDHALITDHRSQIIRWSKIDYMNGGFMLLPLQGEKEWRFIPRALPWAK